ncbi:hypothetical protein MVES1_003546 [Malassezia vespertilionis]|uniref:Uncharacterized protein n=1 Tax=Malassezia vespertilionis TaxID=2020962 RepID=A0A2N1J8F7_9BASI|nr:uncharacterized protein MVES1_003546 [Malassezia vespertilionis]PKI82828.1 hypothetical protein MVES_003123 [Malassezia vespertilionis]WFD08175.1 hypothetical protein MVES1_003546 [Malassezia vespertilionis]
MDSSHTNRGVHDAVLNKMMHTFSSSPDSLANHERKQFVIKDNQSPVIWRPFDLAMLQPKKENVMQERGKTGVYSDTVEALDAESSRRRAPSARQDRLRNLGTRFFKIRRPDAPEDPLNNVLTTSEPDLECNPGVERQQASTPLGMRIARSRSLKCTPPRRKPVPLLHTLATPAKQTSFPLSAPPRPPKSALRRQANPTLTTKHTRNASEDTVLSQDVPSLASDTESTESAACELDMLRCVRPDPLFCSDEPKPTLWFTPPPLVAL